MMHPQLTVGTDARGSACWVVQGQGIVVHCATGQEALAVLAALAQSAGVAPPTR